MAEKQEVVKQENTNLANSEKFTNMVIREFGSNVAGVLPVTDYQRQLIQGYFIQIDRSLKSAEERRIRQNDGNKDHKWDNNDPINWNTIDLNQLALDVMHFARMGLDMMQDNMLTAIPFKDNNRTAKTGTKMYTVNLMKGYNGIQYIAEKYALEKPESVTVELVYSTDTFRPIKKSVNNKVESYEFEINNPFDRGDIIGGFGYIEFSDPQKNRLIMLTKKDIEKRKPKKGVYECEIIRLPEPQEGDPSGSGTSGGEGSGVEIMSRVGAGTCVTLRLVGVAPVLAPDEDDVDEENEAIDWSLG